MQNYKRVYDYIYEYWKRIYETYSKDALAYIVTYYHMDSTSTIWDSDEIMSGSYEKIGSLSGIKWEKIYYLPVFYITETSTDYEAKDEGLINEGKLELVIPSSYGFTPMPNDIIHLDHSLLLDDAFTRSRNGLYTVSGSKKQSPYDKSFWYLYCNVEQSRSIKELDKQVSKNSVFFEYTKKIYTIDDAIDLTELMIRNRNLTDQIDPLFNNNSGLFLI